MSHKFQMLRLWTRFVRMSDQRLTLLCDIQETRSKTLLTFIEKCSVDIWNKPKLRTYEHKDELQCRTLCEVQFKQMTNIPTCTVQRSGTLTFILESGSFNATPEEGRLCLLCNMGEVKNEAHFVFCCPVYRDMRDVFYSKMISIYVDIFWLDDCEQGNLVPGRICL